MRNRLLTTLFLVAMAVAIAATPMVAQMRQPRMHVWTKLSVGGSQGTPLFYVDGYTGNIVTSGTLTATGGVVGGSDTGTFADGSVSTPSMAFTTDPNSGFYKLGNDNWGLSLGGVKRWDIGIAGTSLTGTWAVSDASTFTGNVGCDGGFDVDGTGFVITDATFAISWVPTNTTGDAFLMDGILTSTGTVLKIRTDDDVTSGAFRAIEILGGSSYNVEVWSVGEDGAQAITSASTATDSLTITRLAATSGSHIVLDGDTDTMDADTYFMSILATADHNSQVFYIDRYGAIYAGGGQSIDNASGRKMIQGYYIGATTALTGDGVGVYGNARVTMDSAAGKVFGGYFKAGNGTGTGYDIQIIRGVYIEGVKKAGAGAVITAARGLEINMDWDAATATTTTLTGARIEIQTGSSASAATQSAGVHITNQSVQGTGQAVEAAILVTQISCGSSQGFNYGMDFGDDGFVDDGLTFNRNLFATADIRLAYGETINNSTTDGTVTIGCTILESDSRWENGAFQAGTAYSSNELIEIHGDLASGTYRNAMVRLRVDPSDAQTTGRVMPLNVQAYGNADGDTDDLYQLTGILAEAGIKEACELITGGEMAAGWFKVEDLTQDLTATGDVFSIVLANQFGGTSTFAGEHAFICLRGESPDGRGVESLIFHNDLGTHDAQSFLKTTHAISATATDWLSTKTLTGSTSLDLENDAAILVEIKGVDYWLPLYNG